MRSEIRTAARLTAVFVVLFLTYQILLLILVGTHVTIFGHSHSRRGRSSTQQGTAKSTPRLRVWRLEHPLLPHADQDAPPRVAASWTRYHPLTRFLLPPQDASLHWKKHSSGLQARLPLWYSIRKKHMLRFRYCWFQLSRYGHCLLTDRRWYRTLRPLPAMQGEPQRRGQMVYCIPSPVLLGRNGSLVLGRIPEQARWQRAAHLLDQILRAFRHRYPGRETSLAVKDLNSKVLFHYDAHKPMYGASMLKVFVMYAVFKKLRRIVQEAKDMEQRLSSLQEQGERYRQVIQFLQEKQLPQEVVTYRNKLAQIQERHSRISALLAELQTYASQLESLVVPMITHSENPPFHWFRAHLGDQFFRFYMEKLRLKYNDWKPEVCRNTTAADLAIMFEWLYHKQLFASKHFADRCLQLLKANDRKGLAAQLPRSIAVAEKRGLWLGNAVTLRHTTGIVYLPGHPFIVSVMTRSSPADEGLVLDALHMFSHLALVIARDVYGFHPR